MRTYVHRVKALVDVREFEFVRDIFVHFDISLQIIYHGRDGAQRSCMKMSLALTFHNSRQLGPPFHTSESGPTPDTPSDQLEPPLTSQFTTRHINQTKLTVE